MRFVGRVALPCWLFLVLCLPATGSPADPGPDVLRINMRHLQIPVRVDAGRKCEIKELQLFASTDEGKAWQQVATCSPGGDAFQFEAPGEGIYWFTLRIVHTDGRVEPCNLFGTPASLKVQVVTEEPKPRKDTEKATVKDLKAAVKALRQQLDQIEKRLSEFDKPKEK